MAEIKPAEVSAILKQQLSGFTTETQLEEVGSVLQVGDGIARIYGLNNVQSGELVEFANGLQGIVLNLEEDNVGAVLLGITIDYSLHILTHYKHNSNVETLYKDIVKPLLMSSSTTAIAFLCLLFVHSEALKDLGIFAAICVMISAIFSLLIIPHLYKPKRVTEDKPKTVLDNIAYFSFHKNKKP
jgi:predicted RND superfamily exporter protein